MEAVELVQNGLTQRLLAEVDLREDVFRMSVASVSDRRETNISKRMADVVFVRTTLLQT